MIKLPEINKEIVKAHKEWIKDNVRCSLQEKIKNEKSIDKKIIYVCKNLTDICIGNDLETHIKKIGVIENKKSSKILEEIFDYSNFSREIPPKWGRHKFLTELKVRTCTYCNRQYITSYDEDDSKKTTADLDHFFAKSKYPYLALSLYNFIPSCAICNRTFKGAQSTYEKNKLKVIYPYKESFGEKCSFTLKFETFKEFETFEEFEVKLKYKKQEERVKKTIEMFKLDQVYKTTHNDYIRDMLETFSIYTDDYIEEMSKTLGGNNNIVLEFQEAIKSSYKFKIKSNEPLGKLTNDILLEYGIDLN